MMLLVSKAIEEKKEKMFCFISFPMLYSVQTCLTSIVDCNAQYGVTVTNLGMKQYI